VPSTLPLFDFGDDGNERASSWMHSKANDIRTFITQRRIKVIRIKDSKILFVLNSNRLKIVE
jgi:hypothetical protein